MMARGTSADMTVLALVGERGREVGEFLEELGEAGRARSVVVIVSTSDQSPLLRIRAALAATVDCRIFLRTGKNRFCWLWIRLRDSRWRNGKSDWRRESRRLLKDIHRRVFTIAVSVGGTGWSIQPWKHHCVLYGADGRRR